MLLEKCLIQWKKTLRMNNRRFLWKKLKKHQFDEYKKKSPPARNLSNLNKSIKTICKILM